VSARATSRIFRFGLFEADLQNAHLTRKGVRVRLQEQPFRILATLLEHSGQIVTREELRQALWPAGTYVDFDGNLNSALKRLRAALDDDADNPRFIETVPKRGYRFIAPVNVESPRLPIEAAPLTPAASSSSATAADGPAASAPANDPTVPRFSPSNRRLLLVATVIVLGLSMSAIAWMHSSKERNGTPPRDLAYPRAKSIAVIPFANAGADADLDYLRFALASDVITDLTYARSISVRPFTSTMQYAAQPQDPVAVGRQLKVSYVISGDFSRQSGDLKVTAELTRVADERVIWRDSVSAPTGELVHLHLDFTQRLQDGVLAALGEREVAGEIPMPHSQRAYELYLRSIGVPRDAAPNEFAITGLEASVSEDPNYAPAWEELGWRYYLDAEYGSGGEAAYKKSEEASARAAALDPNGTANWLAVRVEHGDLEGAYDLAKGLLLRRPDSSEAHFEMAYVYRYAGLLDQAATECDAALDIDPGNFVLRSCAKVFMYRRDYKRAAVFVDLDGSSGWSARQKMQIALREGGDPAVLALATVAVESGYSDSEIVQARLQNRAPAALNAIAKEAESEADAEADPEEKYEVAAMLSYAGQADRGMSVLTGAINHQYCALPMLESDPLLAPLRARPYFQALKGRAETCQRNFLAHSNASAASLLGSN
jgi:DNA-binding winged helix-turn-helix (wHTH) protein/TolB-like protein